MLYLNWNRLKQYSNTTITIPYAIKLKNIHCPMFIHIKYCRSNKKIDGKDTSNYYFLLTNLFK